MSKKKIAAILISACAIGILLVVGCASTSGPVYIGRTMFIPIKSSPEGAEVILDGRQKGVTPMTLQFSYISDPRGNHNDETRERIIKIEKDGYEPYVLSFSIKGKEHEKIPGLILLRTLDNRVKTGGSPDKEQEKTPELKEERKKYKEVLEEIEKPGKEITLFKGKNDTQQIKQYNETMADNQNVYRRVYTIQTGSFIEIEHAQKQFDSIVQGLNEKELDYLRIEKVGKFYSVRLGKFNGYTAAEEFIQAVKPRLSTAIIVEAYIKDDRIIRSYKK